MVKNFSPGRARFDAHVVVEVGEVSVFLSQPPHSPRFARLARRPDVVLVWLSCSSWFGLLCLTAFMFYLNVPVFVVCLLWHKWSTL